MILTMFVAVLAQAAPVASAPPVPAPAAPSAAGAGDPAGTVVVTAERLSDLQARLAACIARRCPADQDAAAALAVAETQFIAGDYASSRRVLNASIARTRGQAGKYPIPVSDLYRANGQVARHMGEDKDAKTAAIGSYAALNKGFGSGDPRTIGGLIELGDAQLRAGFPDTAEARYREAITRADTAAASGVGVTARFRLATLMAGRYDRTPSPGDVRRVTDALGPLLTTSDTKLANAGLAARLFVAQLAERRGQAGAIDAVLKASPDQARAAPILLSAEPISFSERRIEDGNPLNLAFGINVEHQWIDVAFWITPLGTTRDVEVVRRSRPSTTSWSERVTKSIASRRYSAAKRDEGELGTYRLERYTLTAGYQQLSGTLLRSRSSLPRVEMVDLTIADPKR